MVTMMWQRISQRTLLRASRRRVITRSLASLNLTNRTHNLCQPNQNQLTFNSWRSFTSSDDSSFHGITLPEDKDDRQAQQSSSNPMIQEAEVVKSDEDKQKLRESIAEVVRAELSAYSTPKQNNTQMNGDEDKENALEGYERLLQMLDIAQDRHDSIKANDTLEYTQSIMDLGELHYQLGNMEQSQDMFMAVLKQLLENNTDNGGSIMMMVAQSMHSLGSVHARCGEFDEAFRWYEESLRRKNEIIRESSNSESINSYHFELGKTHNALAALQTMRGGMQWREAMSMFQLAERHQLHGHLRDDGDALGMEENVVTKQILEKLTPHHVQSIVNIRFNVGKLLQQHAQYDDAVDTFRDALDLARLDVERMTTDDVKDNGTYAAVGHPSPFERKNAVVELLVQIADCHASAQNFDEAAQAYEEALGYHIFFRRWKGNSDESKGQETSVLPATFSATNIKIDIENATTMEAAIRSNLAHALAHIGQEKLGLEHYEASLKIKRQIGGSDHVEVAHTLMGMGAVYGGPLRDFATALNCFKEALFIYRGKMNELTDEFGLSGSNKFFEDEDTVELDGYIENAVKNIGLIEAGLLKDREEGIIKKRR